MVLWWGHAPWFLCYQLDFLLDFFTEAGSYQWLKDATSFGLLSNKSAEKLEGNIQKIANSPYEIGHFHPLCSIFLCKWAKWCHFQSENSVRKAVWGMFQYFEYLDLNYSALLAD